MGDLFKLFPLSSQKLGVLSQFVKKLDSVPGLGAIPGLSAVVASGSLLEAAPKLISSGHPPDEVLFEMMCRWFRKIFSI